MGLIAILDDNTINKIAAGEVVDRPASIVKELVENSIDAGATHISVEIKNGGISYIKISDNGKGIAADDVEIAFERHATSKIRKESDILKITSLGFRGEALASVASIAKVTMETKTKDEHTGTRIVIEGGKTLELEEIAANKGTSITVENVFFNVPARYKFLKKDYTEAGYIEDVITRMAIIHPEISFKFVSNNKQIINTTGSGDIKLAVYNIFGKDIASELIPVEYEYKSMKVSGVIGTPKTSRSTRQYEFTYINGRFVKDKTLMTALEKAFEQNLNIGKFPFAILNLELSPSEVDVNVHPAKLEVKFEHESDVFDTLYHGVTNALLDYHKRTSPFAMEIKPEVQSVPNVDVEKVVTNIASKSDESFTMPVIPTYSVDTVDTNTEKTQEIVQVVETIETKSEEQIPTYTYTEPVLTREVEYVGKEGILEIKDIVDSVNEEEKKEYETKINYKYVGALFDTYILIEIEEKLYIIDQHAAHERLLYEQIKEMYYSKSKETQMLLIPSLVELKHNEQELVMRNKELFEETGFEIEEFGDNMIKISGVPNIGYDMDYVELFKDTLDELKMETKTTKEEREERFLATIACKAAVKGNMKLTATEHVALIDKMVKLDRPFTCPHGRPTAYEISKYEIERRFARK